MTKRMDRAKWRKHVLNRLASSAPGASTLRNQGAKGLVKAARNYLKDVHLSDFVVPTESEFRATLDVHTERLREAFPRGGRHWGTARKVLNIFLRDALYNVYLASAYRLKRIESWLEVPLDLDVATRLLEEDRRRHLPRWTRIKLLRPPTSRQYQDFARETAADMGLARVHLDVLYWRKLG